MLIAAIMMCVRNLPRVQPMREHCKYDSARCGRAACLRNLLSFATARLDDPSSQGRRSYWDHGSTRSRIGDMVGVKEDEVALQLQCAKASAGMQRLSRDLQITFKLWTPRPLVFEGKINDDDVRGRGISGMVRGPPKLGATPQLIKRGRHG